MFFLLFLHQPISTLFPYTTLFRSFSYRSPKSRSSRVSQLVKKKGESICPLSRQSPPPVPMNRVSSTKSRDRKSTRLNSSHVSISYAVFCLKKKKSIIYKLVFTK